MGLSRRASFAYGIAASGSQCSSHDDDDRPLRATISKESIDLLACTQEEEDMDHQSEERQNAVAATSTAFHSAHCAMHALRTTLSLELVGLDNFKASFEA